MKRGPVIFDGPRIAGMLQEDVNAEERAIAQYREHIAAIDDPDITRSLERIIADEESHHGDFAHYVEKRDPEEESAPSRRWRKRMNRWPAFCRRTSPTSTRWCSSIWPIRS